VSDAPAPLPPAAAAVAIDAPLLLLLLLVVAALALLQGATPEQQQQPDRFTNFAIAVVVQTMQLCWWLTAVKEATAAAFW
jgi:ABC-type sugar transport system substrate-binding protein